MIRYFLLAFAAASSTAAGALEAQPSSPAREPERWLLAFVDVETTGLEPGHHELIDVGIVMTDLEGGEVGRFYRRIQPRHPERTAPGARAINAFDPERWRELGAVPPAQGVRLLREFHRATAGDRSVMLVALNSHFDAAFLDHLFRAVAAETGASWRDLYHYFVLDLPSMAWSLGLRQLSGRELAMELGVEDEPRIAERHTGLTGAELNVRLYRALLERQRAASVEP